MLSDRDEFGLEEEENRFKCEVGRMVGAVVDRVVARLVDCVVAGLVASRGGRWMACEWRSGSAQRWRNAMLLPV